MDYAFISQVASNTPVGKSQVESMSVTFGGLVFFLGFLTSAIALIKLIVDISAKANQLKNDIDRADLIINNKIDTLSDKLDKSLAALDSQLLLIERRTVSIETRLQDMELFLSAKHGFVARRYQPSIDDGIPSGLLR